MARDAALIVQGDEFDRGGAGRAEFVNQQGFIVSAKSVHQHALDACIVDGIGNDDAHDGCRASTLAAHKIALANVEAIVSQDRVGGGARR